MHTSLGVLGLGALLVGLPTSGPAQSSAPGLDPAQPITQYVHDVWTIDQGLPQNSVFTLAQPADGYLWLGTEAGFARFDGVRFTTYNTANTPGLTDTYVSALLVDREGARWIGTWVGGVMRLTDGKAVEVPGASGSMVNCLYEDRTGTIWAGRGTGLARLRGGRFETIPGLTGSAYTIAENGDGTLLVGTDDGVYAWRDEQLRRWQPEGRRIEGTILTLLNNGQGTLWLAGTDALYRASAGKVDRYAAADGLPDGGVTALVEGRNGELWIGTDGGGLARLAKGRFQRFTVTDGLSDDRVASLVMDREGSLWVGTRTGGLNRFREPILPIYTTREGLSADVVWSVYGDRQGTLWIGTSGGGLNRFHDGRFISYGTKDGLPGNSVYATIETSDSTLWVATNRGVARRRRGHWESFSASAGFPEGRVSAFLQDRNGALWLGADPGLYRWQGGRIHDFSGEAGVEAAKVRTIAEDRDGSLWVGTHGVGLVRMHDGRFTSFTSKDGLSSDIVESLYLDEHGLWVGTTGGIDLLQDGHITPLPLANGVVMTDVFKIVNDDQGNLWLSANQGLVRVSEQDLLSAAAGKAGGVPVHDMVSLDGLRRIEFNGASQDAGWKSPDGRLWFPSIKGLVMVNPADLKNNPVLPPVHVERLVVDGQPVDLTTGITLSPGRGSLEFHYTATSLLIPERVRFRYRLEGYDDDWVEAGTRRVAYYTHVPGGAYRFHVIAANNDGLWNDSGAVLPLKLGLHYYQAWWFAGLLLLSALAVIAGVFRYRVRRIEQRARELAALVAERTSELQLEVEERRRTEERYRHLFDANPQPVWVTDRDTLSFLAVNDSATHHYGYTREEFSAMRLTDLQPPDQGVALPEWIRAAGDGWRGTSMWLHRKKDGTPIEVEVAAHAFTFAGRPAALIVAADVTARRDLEERLRQAQKMEAVGQLAGGIAHDLNNVLTAVMAHVDLALSGLPKDVPVLGDLTQAQAAAHRGATMIRRLLGFSRRERLVLKPLHLEQLIASLAPSIRRMLPEQIELVITTGPDVLQVAADAASVQQMVLNLTTNARDAMPDRGRLTIDVSVATPADKQMAAQEWGTPGHYVVLSVMDNGTGMDAETAARVFEPYFSTKPADQGTGLGMAMVYGLMKQQLGYVLVNTAPGAGTEVRLYFPVSHELVPATVPEARPVRQDKGQTILVVEDQEAVRSAATRALTRYGYKVLTATDGEEGLQVWLAHADAIDLVISDAIMPRMGGLELFEAVSGVRAGVRFLLTSGYTGEEVQKSAPTKAELPFLSKPWTVNELLTKVKEVLA